MLMEEILDNKMYQSKEIRTVW